MTDKPDMDACMDAGRPGPEHHRLRRFDGVWHAEVSIYFNGPDAAPMRSTGTMTNTSILGGRFIQHDYAGDGDQPFSGVGHFGFDAGSGLYQGTWLDIMSTEITTETGGYDEASDTYTMRGTVFHPGFGKEVAKRSVFRVEGNDRYVMEQFFPAPDGSEARVMEIVYTRKG